MWKAIKKEVVASREKLSQQTPKMPQAFMYSMVLQRQHFACQYIDRECVLQEVGIGNRLDCSNLFMQLTSLECVCVCTRVCANASMYNINYLTLHFPGKIFWLKGLLFQNFLLLISPLH